VTAVIIRATMKETRCMCYCMTVYVCVVCILLFHRLPVYCVHQLNVLVKFNTVNAWTVKYIKFHAVAVRLLIA
jgi:hypothetical protein